MKEPNYKYDWNEVVSIVENAAEEFRPSQVCAVVGMRIIENKLQAEAAGFSIGSILFQVEFSDGHIIEVGESLLQKKAMA